MENRRSARRLWLGIALLTMANACGTTQGDQATNGFVAPNALVREEIARRIDQIPYMHKEQLLDNLLWLAGQGEQAMPQLFGALQHGDAKVRSSACWCLGWNGDKRAIPRLQELADRETDEVVRLEIARQLLALGDFGRAPQLIAGLESDRRHVRYLCYEALKAQTGQDFGYDHRVEDASERAGAVARWRAWWTDLQGDRMQTRSSAAAQGTGANTATRGAAVPESLAPTPAAPGDSVATPTLAPAPATRTPDPNPSVRGARPATRPGTQPASRPAERAEFEFK